MEENTNQPSPAFKLFLEGTFITSTLGSSLVFILYPPWSLLCGLLVFFGLIAGLVFREHANNTFYRWFLLIPIGWLLFILSLTVARLLKVYGIA